MIDITKSKVGDKVHYQPRYYGKDKWENGIIKEVPEIVTVETNAVRVVYHCEDNWGCFDSYTGALTRIEDLKLGWR